MAREQRQNGKEQRDVYRLEPSLDAALTRTTVRQCALQPTPSYRLFPVRCSDDESDLNCLRRHGSSDRTSIAAPKVTRALRGCLAVNLRSLALLSAVTVGISSGFQIPTVYNPEAERASIEGLVTLNGQQGQADAVPGVLVTLSGGLSGLKSLSDTTDAEGHYRCAQLSPGTYTIEARLDGFQPFSESIVLTQGEAKIENVSLELDKVVQKIEVRDKAAEVSTDSADSTATVSGSQFTSLPLAEQKFKAALPLVPGVVRTEDGKLNFKGAPENQGMLLVDSAQTVDPVTGSFSIPVPLDAIQTMSCRQGPLQRRIRRVFGRLDVHRD